MPATWPCAARALLALLPASALACGESLAPARMQLLSNDRHQLAFDAGPEPIAVGRHFALDIVVCPRPGAGAPVTLKVDADMPAHRHGMNYRPTLRRTGDGRWRAEGLMFHMPGRWRLHFEISADGRVERLAHDIELP